MSGTETRIEYEVQREMVDGAWGKVAAFDALDAAFRCLDVAFAHDLMSHRIRKYTTTAETVHTIIITHQATAYEGDPPADAPGA